MEYQMGQFERDCLAASKSDERFDNVNADEIADHHGIDPKYVLAEIKAIRKFREVMTK